jgi:hypothetical protein
MIRDTRLKTSQVFSHFQFRVNFIGNIQLPDIKPASNVRAIPRDNDGPI